MSRVHDKPELRTIRRALRTHPTNAEAALWKGLRRRQLHGRRFRRQHSIGSYVLDFYCPDERLAIEVDGGVHRDPVRADYDSRRQRWLEGQGLRVIRFTNEEVFQHIDVVLSAITASFFPVRTTSAPDASDGAGDTSVSLPPLRGGRAGEGGPVVRRRASSRPGGAPPPPPPPPGGGGGWRGGAPTPPPPHPRARC